MYVITNMNVMNISNIILKYNFTIISIKKGIYKSLKNKDFLIFS